jgi:hypothetical protein
MSTDYKDPSDLRNITFERLKFEGNKLGHQFNEWNNFFNIQSAIRVSGKTHNTSFTEIEMWSIFSNRFLILDREHLSEYKLFTKQEVLKMIESAYYEGYNDCEYQDKQETKNELADNYIKKQKSCI